VAAHRDDALGAARAAGEAGVAHDAELAAGAVAGAAEDQLLRCCLGKRVGQAGRLHGVGLVQRHGGAPRVGLCIDPALAAGPRDALGVEALHRHDAALRTQRVRVAGGAACRHGAVAGAEDAAILERDAGDLGAGEPVELAGDDGVPELLVRLPGGFEVGSVQAQLQGRRIGGVAGQVVRRVHVGQGAVVAEVDVVGVDAGVHECHGGHGAEHGLRRVGDVVGGRIVGCTAGKKDAHEEQRQQDAHGRPEAPLYFKNVEGGALLKNVRCGRQDLNLRTTKDPILSRAPLARLGYSRVGLRT
jgi:hypothetical protein